MQRTEQAFGPPGNECRLGRAARWILFCGSRCDVEGRVHTRRDRQDPAPGTVDVVLRSTREHAVLQVRDTGVGIAESDLAHIFDRFYRADQSRTLTEGSGLGFAIAKWIADMHHADLDVVREVHKGTVFRVIFPCV